MIKWTKGLRTVNENLHVLSPMVLPFHKYRVVRIINKWLLDRQLDRSISKLGFEKPVLWSYVPNAVQFLGKWREKVSVYHCVDELTANPLIPADTVRTMEANFLLKVNIVFTTSPSLFDSKRKLNANTNYLPNVADFDHFSQASRNETAIHKEIASIPVPRLGFIGAISQYKLDLKLINSIAEKHSEWSLVLIGAKGEGEKEAEMGELEKYKNVFILGGRNYNILPQYLKGFDVCLLPNALNEYTKNMFPMKFFEYLSAGKPVVATNLAALSEFSEQCYLSRSHEEFEKNIIKALSEDSPAKKSTRMETAKAFTWEKRLDEMSDIIGEYLNRGKSGN
jgi:glycosyltransferase involved in cell wall biosynthesis